MSPFVLLSLLTVSLFVPIFDDNQEPEEDSDPIDPGDPSDPGSVTNGTVGNDILTALLGETVNGLDGDDTLTAAAGSDGAVLNGGSGADSLSLEGSNGAAFGGDGQDVITMNGTEENGPGSNLTADGGAGDDTITASGIGGTVNGGRAEDMITVTGQFDSVSGGEGNDTIVADSAAFGGGATIDGGIGNDVITVSESAGISTLSTINGGAGDDMISDQLAYDGAPLSITDVIRGGEGADTFTFSVSGADSVAGENADLGTIALITDFAAAEDALVIDPSFLAGENPEAEQFDSNFELVEAGDGSYTDVIFSVSTDGSAHTMSGTIRLEGVQGLTLGALDISVALGALS